MNAVCVAVVWFFAGAAVGVGGTFVWAHRRAQKWNRHYQNMLRPRMERIAAGLQADPDDEEPW